MTRDAPGPDHGTVGDLIAAHAQRAPTAPAIVSRDATTVTYATLVEHVAAFGHTLADAGVGAHHRVAVLQPNGPAMATTVLGVIANAVAAPLNPQYTADELQFSLTDLAPSLLLVGETLDTPAREVAATLGVPVVDIADAITPSRGQAGGAPPADVPARAPDDDALLLHTSGTTSRPKLVPLTQRNLSTSARNVATTLALAPDDRCFNVMPLFHIHGIVAALLASLASGGSVVCTGAFDPGDVLQSMHASKPTWYTAVPTIHQAMLDALSRGSAPAPSLRFIRSSSAALPATTLARLEDAFGVPVIEAYGMTEAAHQMASNPRTAIRKAGTVGPAAGPEIGILADGVVTQRPGAVGEIAIRGANVTRGYVDNPDANSAAFVDGWFRTGDLGSLDADGYLTITGRLKEIVNRGGEKVAPVEVEEALLAHPDVEQAVAFAVAHPSLGEDVAAAVVVHDVATVSRAELRRYAGERLAPYKVPHRILFVDEIPKGATGKVQRVGMAERLGLDPLAVDRAVVAPRDATEQQLVDIFADVLQLDGPVGVTDDFVELGADSLHFEELLAEIERVFDRSLPASTLLHETTPERIAIVLRTPADETGSAEPTLVPIQPAGTRPPLFCIMRADVLVTARHFTAALGPDQPIFGIWMPSMHGPDHDGPSIEQIAAACRRVIGEVQPHGPYHLFGYSIGGLVAYELARQFATSGESTALVVMADTPYLGPLPSTRDRVTKLFSSEGPRALARRAANVARRVPGVRAAIPSRPSTALEQRALEFRAVGVDLPATIRRERAYVSSSRPPAAPIVLLRCRDTMEIVSGGSPVLGWEQYATDRWEVHDVPGSHDSMLGEPHVHVLAEHVARCLRDAQGRVGPTPR